MHYIYYRMTKLNSNADENLKGHLNENFTKGVKEVTINCLAAEVIKQDAALLILIPVKNYQCECIANSTSATDNIHTRNSKNNCKLRAFVSQRKKTTKLQLQQISVFICNHEDQIGMV